MVISVVLHSTRKMEKNYSDTVRQLYYTLLADQVPPAKVSSIIKSVLKSFLPTLNIDELELPRERYAGYMRREELKTISMVHKAYTLAETKSFSLNSDSTTNFQKKLGGVAVKGTVSRYKRIFSNGSRMRIPNI